MRYGHASDLALVLKMEAAIIRAFLGRRSPLYGFSLMVVGVRWNTFVGRKWEITSDMAVVLGILLPSVRVMLRDVAGAPPFAGEDSGRSMSIGVDAMAGRKED